MSLSRKEKLHIAHIFGNAKSENTHLRDLLARLALMARTSGGVSGPDKDLMEVCEEAEDFLAATRAAA